MVSKKVTVINPQGFHMRPAQVFVSAMGRYDCTVNIRFNGKTISAASIMNLMGSCIRMDSEIEIQCEGPQEQEALETAVRLVESGLGEL